MLRAEMIRIRACGFVNSGPISMKKTAHNKLTERCDAGNVPDNGWHFSFIILILLVNFNSRFGLTGKAARPGTFGIMI